MFRRLRLVPCLVAVVTGIAMNGCTPSDQGPLGEEKEPHFVLGKARVNAMDYPGAIEAFEQSLEANPRSSSAHFELGWLYDERASDPAAAIYHYQQYLKLRPNADNAEVIRQRIYRCKQQLAADVLPLPSAPAAQQQLEKLAEQNRQLQTEVDQWRAWYTASQAAARTNPPVGAAPAAVPRGSAASGPERATTPAATATTRTASRRKHTVAAGETAVRIARKYGVTLDALVAANPGLNPNRVRVGQVLNIPSS